MTQTITIDGLENLQDLYDGVSEDFADIELVPWMHKELDNLSDWERGLFNSQTSPDGQAWAPNAPRTIKQKGHSRILRGKPSLGFRLSTSLTLKSHASTGDAVREAVEMTEAGELAFGTSLEYSAINDRQRGNAPARPHVGINETELDKIAERAADYCLKELAKG